MGPRKGLERSGGSSCEDGKRWSALAWRRRFIIMNFYPANATVLSNASAACLESRRVCCTTMGRSDSITLA